MGSFLSTPLPRLVFSVASWLFVSPSHRFGIVFKIGIARKTYILFGTISTIPTITVMNDLD